MMRINYSMSARVVQDPVLTESSTNILPYQIGPITDMMCFPRISTIRWWRLSNKCKLECSHIFSKIILRKGHNDHILLPFQDILWRISRLFHNHQIFHLLYRLIDSDEFEGVIRNPFQPNMIVWWVFSGPFQTLRTVSLIYAVWAVLADGVVLRLLLLNG